MEPVRAGLVRTRPGVRGDHDQVTALHARCSPEGLHRRYHSAVPRSWGRVAADSLEPELGWSRVALLDEDLVAIATAGPLSTTDLEVAVLVEDERQGQGIGSRLLREVATDAARRGYRTLLSVVQPDNAAVTEAAARRAGFTFTARRQGGLGHLVLTLPDARTEMSQPA